MSAFERIGVLGASACIACGSQTPSDEPVASAPGSFAGPAPSVPASGPAKTPAAVAPRPTGAMPMGPSASLSTGVVAPATGACSSATVGDPTSTMATSVAIVAAGGDAPAAPSGMAGAGGSHGGAGGTTALGGAGSGAGGTALGGAGGGTGAGGNGDSAGGAGGAESRVALFLLLGQSNMEGAPQPENQDRTTDGRISVLAYDDCQNVDRQYGEWYLASPPLHSCAAGLGPGDYFAKTLIEQLPDGYTIGLVPCAVNGAPIDLFRKDVPRTGYDLPPDNHWNTGYEWIVSRAQQAQQVGVIRGILFHQGESDFNQSVWVDKVAELVRDLRSDLALGEVPFLAGELYRDGCCPEHNALVEQLAELVPNAHVVSSEGLTGVDVYHFDLASQRELGRRYAETMQGVLTLP